MKFVRSGASLLMVMILAACSSADSRRQASGGFDYLQTPNLQTWKPLPAHPTKTTDTYQIPLGNFEGAVGGDVDIRPPDQLLNLIPGARFRVDTTAVEMALPTEASLNQLEITIDQMIAQGRLQAKREGQNQIQTQWISQSADSNVEVEMRFLFLPDRQNGQYGYEIRLSDWRSESEIDVNRLNELRKRFLTGMANRILTQYDLDTRENARKEALARVNDIPVTLGKDRSGLDIVVARASYDVMWERLPSVLAEMGFSIEARNRSQGVIEVKYSPADDDYWKALGIPPLQLDRSNINIQVGDLGNRTSISMTDATGVPLNYQSLDEFSKALSVAISKQVA